MEVRGDWLEARGSWPHWGEKRRGGGEGERSCLSDTKSCWPESLGKLCADGVKFVQH